MSQIIDIHTHILYGIDDGSSDLDMSLELIKREYDQGVRGIFLTNHSYGMEYDYKDYYTRFDELTSIVSEKYSDLKLYKGCEILCYRYEMPEIVRKIRNGTFPTMNGTEYILMEFDPDETEGMEEVEYCLRYAIDEGFIPIVAHVERYSRIYDNPLENLKTIKKLGCRTQINLYSVEQDRGLVGGGTRKELANLFLKNKLVDFVGTDTHRLDYKSPEAEVGAEAIQRLYPDVAEDVLYKNCQVLIN